MDLVCQSHNPLTGFASPGLGNGYFLGAGKTFAQHPGSLIGGKPGAINISGHVGAVMLDNLKAADGTVILLSFLGVIYRHVQCLLNTAHHLAAFGHCRSLDYFLHRAPPLVQLPQDILLGYLYLVKNHLTQLIIGDSL